MTQGAPLQACEAASDSALIMRSTVIAQRVGCLLQRCHAALLAFTGFVHGDAVVHTE